MISPRIRHSRTITQAAGIDDRRFLEIVETLRRIARSDDPDIWTLLEKECEFLGRWMKTGEMDKLRDWNLRKLEAKLRRRRSGKTASSAVSPVTKIGIDSRTRP